MFKKTLGDCKHLQKVYEDLKRLTISEETLRRFKKTKKKFSNFKKAGKYLRTRFKKVQGIAQQSIKNGGASARLPEPIREEVISSLYVSSDRDPPTKFMCSR